MAFAPDRETPPPSPPPAPPSLPEGPQRPGVQLPPAVAILLGAMALVMLLRQVLPFDLDHRLLVTLGLALFISGDFQWDRLYTLVTSVFVHGGWLHLIFNGIWIAILGGKVQQLIGTTRFLAFFFTTAICAGLAETVINWGLTTLVIGASGGVFGLIGAAGHIWAVKSWQSPMERWKSLLGYGALMMALNLGYAFVGDVPGSDGEAISWEAHSGGLLAGLLLFPLFLRRGHRSGEEASTHEIGPDQHQDRKDH